MLLKRVFFFLFLLSSAGFVMGFVLHFGGLLGSMLIGSYSDDMLFFLSIGLFALWIPTLIVTVMTDKGNWRNVLDFFKPSIINAPRWMKLLCLLTCLYGGVIFLTSGLVVTGLIMGEGRSPSNTRGNWVLSDHGRVVREMTREEVARHKIHEFRSSSALIMAFYSVPMVLFRSKASENKRGRTDRESDERR